MREPQFGNIVGESLVPGTRCLFETIKRFLEKTDMLRIPGITKSRRLVHIHGFVKISMQKGILDI
jgi:hypothetical protein